MPKKTRLLYRDHRRTKTKQPLQRLILSGEMSKVEYVLLPVPGFSSVYMGVDGCFLEAFPFHHAEIRYRMMAISSDLEATRVYSEPSDIDMIHEYCTIPLRASTVEDFYYQLHGLFQIDYIQELMFTDYDCGRNCFMSLEDLEIYVYDTPDHEMLRFERYATYEQKVLNMEEVGRDLRRAFGIIGASDYKYPTFLYEDRDGFPTWRMVYGNFDLTSSIERVAFGSIHTNGTYIEIKDDEYDQLLRCQSAYLQISWYDFNTEQSPKLEVDAESLALTSVYEIDRFAFNSGDGPAHDECVELAEGAGTYMLVTIGTSAYDFDEIAFLIEYLPAILRTHHELISAMTADPVESLTPEIQHHNTSVVSEMRIEVGERHPASTQLRIITDVWQAHQPNLKQVCYLLGLQEKSP